VSVYIPFKRSVGSLERLRTVGGGMPVNRESSLKGQFPKGMIPNRETTMLFSNGLVYCMQSPVSSSSHLLSPV
jgi:hypothetical protein